MDDDLLSIGRFARLAGLSVGALRHYDELDLLRPADIDRFTGYRRYRRAQLETARTIARLRDLEVPLDEIREVLAMDDPAAQRRRLAVHRSRIAARTDRLTRLLHVVGRMTDGKDPIMTNTVSDPGNADFFARQPEFLGKPDCLATPMLEQFGCCWHWRPASGSYR